MVQLLIWEAVALIAVVWILFGLCGACAAIYQDYPREFAIAVIFVWPALLFWMVVYEWLGDWLAKRRATHTASAKRR